MSVHVWDRRLKLHRFDYDRIRQMLCQLMNDQPWYHTYANKSIKIPQTTRRDLVDILGKVNEEPSCEIVTASIVHCGSMRFALNSWRSHYFKYLNGSSTYQLLVVEVRRMSNIVPLHERLLTSLPLVSCHHHLYRTSRSIHESPQSEKR